MSTQVVKGLPYNCAVTVMWRANGSMENFLWCRSTEEGSDKFKGLYTYGGKGMSPNRFRTLTPSCNMSLENIVRKLVWANIGAQGHRKIVLHRRNNSETWKAVKGFWDGSFKDNGSSGCGVAIKVADRENR